MFDFEVHFDDSGTDANTPVAVAACYISSKEQWDEFVRNWDEVRETEGFDVFHMCEFVARRRLDTNLSATGITKKRIGSITNWHPSSTLEFGADLRSRFQRHHSTDTCFRNSKTASLPIITHGRFARFCLSFLIGERRPTIATQCNMCFITVL
jgi:hypothetical protein